MANTAYEAELKDSLESYTRKNEDYNLDDFIDTYRVEELLSKTVDFSEKFKIENTVENVKVIEEYSEYDLGDKELDNLENWRRTVWIGAKKCAEEDLRNELVRMIEEKFDEELPSFY